MQLEPGSASSLFSMEQGTVREYFRYNKDKGYSRPCSVYILGKPLGNSNNHINKVAVSTAGW